jgi:hypothetical protein
MTRLLDEAIETLRQLPAEEQDAAADVLFAYMSNDERHHSLRSDQVETVHRIRHDLKTGKTRLATDDEVARLREESQV